MNPRPSLLMQGGCHGENRPSLTSGVGETQMKLMHGSDGWPTDPSKAVQAWKPEKVPDAGWQR